MASEPPQSSSGKGSWAAFLKALASSGGDVSNMTAPPFILSTKSLTEFSSYWTEHPSVFVAPASESDPQKRAMLVLKWLISVLKQQYSSRSDAYGSEKKPLNPFLGELYLGEWNDSAGKTQLISEQVSHHPPVTAYRISNEKHGISLEGYNGQRASFGGRKLGIKQIGHAILHIDEYNEDYLITLPSLHIEGLVFMTPFVELNNFTYIQSSSGYTAKIDYSGKGWLSGKKNSFNAVLYKQGKEKDILYTADGQWTGDFTIKNAQTKQVVETWTAKENKMTPLDLAPLSEQDPLESRRAWQKVSEAQQKGDMELLSREKTKIEVAQRELRKKEQAEGRVWERRYFTKKDKDEFFDALGNKLGLSVEADKTGGIWRFDKEKAEKASRPAVASVDSKETAPIPPQEVLGS